MGCTKSKLDDKVCLKDETTAMHVAYINKNGLQKYYEVMGVEDVSNHNTFEDNSSNLNLGLINIESKSKSNIENKLSSAKVGSEKLSLHSVFSLSQIGS